VLSLGHNGDAGWSTFAIFLLVVFVVAIMLAVFKLCSTKSANVGGRIDKIDIGRFLDSPESIYDGGVIR
jgi:hypothetical protein